MIFCIRVVVLIKDHVGGDTKLVLNSLQYLFHIYDCAISSQDINIVFNFNH